MTVKTQYGQAEVRSILNKAMKLQPLSTEEREVLNFTDLGIEVPGELQTELLNSKRPFKSMKQFIHVVPVKQKRGVYLANDDKADEGELVEFDEVTPIPESNTYLKDVIWEVKKRGSLNKIANGTVNDADVDLVEVLRRSHGRKAVRTENKMIFAKLKEGIIPGTLNLPDDLTSSLISDLDPALEKEVLIVTNQDGWKKMKLMKDSTGEPLVKVVGTPEGPKRYYDGYPVEVFSNKELPSENGKAPIFYGGFAESIKFFEYETMNIAVSKHAEFIRDMLVIRGIEQFDVQKFGTPDYQYKLLPLA